MASVTRSSAGFCSAGASSRRRSPSRHWWIAVSNDIRPQASERSWGPSPGRRTAPRWTPGAAMLRRAVTRRSWMLLVIVAAMWGGSFMLTAIAIRDLAVPVVAFTRTSGCARGLAPIASRRGALAALRGQLWPLLLLGVVQLAAPFLLLGYGQRSVPSGLAGVPVALKPPGA